jgi:hypothetical protein
MKGAARRNSSLLDRTALVDKKAEREEEFNRVAKRVAARAKIMVEISHYLSSNGCSGEK